jgi:hypothetical protein
LWRGSKIREKMTMMKKRVRVAAVAAVRKMVKIAVQEIVMIASEIR